MPEVDQPPDIDRVFEQARKTAAIERGDGRQLARQVVLVTPSRVLMLQSCPAAGSMKQNLVSQIEQVLSPKVKKKVAVIGYTEQKAVTENIQKAIPFFGMLIGIAYIGHSVWVFEGHPSALAAGCKEADVLMVDGHMVPYLSADWQAAVRTVSPAIQIYMHNRENQSLRKMS